MRAVSKKRQILNATVGPFRDALKERIARCELCLKPCSAYYLTLHEIARGSYRRRCLDKPFALLCLHWTSWDSGKIRACHAEVQDEPQIKQLARLYLVRPSDYDLKAFNRLMNPQAPDRITQDQVDVEIRGLLNGRTR